MIILGKPVTKNGNVRLKLVISVATILYLTNKLHFIFEKINILKIISKCESYAADADKFCGLDTKIKFYAGRKKNWNTSCFVLFASVSYFDLIKGYTSLIEKNDCFLIRNSNF